MHRLLATEVFCQAGVSGCSIVTIDNDCVSVVPFEKEVHSTVYIPGSIAILEASKFDEFVADDIYSSGGRFASGDIDYSRKVGTYARWLIFLSHR